MATIKEATSNDEIAQCLPVLSELRSHFKVDSSQFVERVQQQRKKGYHLVYLEDQGKIQAVAGYRIRDTLETPEPRLILESNVERQRAHKFYHRNGLTITSYRFAKDL